MVVITPDPLPVKDVVFVVEDTSSAGFFIPELVQDYIKPILEHFNRGPAEKDVPWAQVKCSSTFTLVLFEASDCIPRTSVSYRGPFTTIKSFMQAFEKIEYVGGMGETRSSGNEGIAMALQCLEELRERRAEVINQEPEQHIVFISNSPSYEIDVMDVPDYVGNNLETLMKLVRERKINFSVVCPRKLPFFIRLYEAGGGDMKVVREKNYAKDPVHLILPRGIPLPEQPLAPRPTTSPALVSSNQTAPNISGPAQQQASSQPTQQLQQPNGSIQKQANFNPVSTPSSMQNQSQQGQFTPNVTMTTASVGASPNFSISQQQAAQRPVMGMTPMQQGMMRPNQQMQMQQAQRMQGTQQQRMQLMQQQLMQQQQQGGQWNQQQQPQPPSNMTAPTQSSVLRDRLSQKVQQQQQAAQAAQQQQQGDNATLKSLLNHPPQAMAPGQGQIRMSALQQQLSRPPAPSSSTLSVSGPSGQQMVTSSMNQQQQQTMQTGPSPQQASNRPRDVIWEGELEWRENTKVDSSHEKATHTVICSVTSSKDNGVIEVKSDNWPRKLIMQLIPKALVHTIGGQYFRNSRSVLFHPEQSESLEALTKVLASGYAGCVHFTGVANCDIKVLILLYSSERNAYLGFIPNEQLQFVDRIRKVIQQQKSEQQAQTRGNMGMVQNQMGQQPQMNVMQQQQIRMTQQGNVNVNIPGGAMAMANAGPSSMMSGSGNAQGINQQQRIQELESLQQNLQQELQALRQRQQQDDGGTGGTGAGGAGMTPQMMQPQQQARLIRPNVMNPQQMQQQMRGQGGLRQMLQQPQGTHYQRPTGGLPFQRPRQQGPGPQGNDPMLRDLLG